MKNLILVAAFFFSLSAFGQDIQCGPNNGIIKKAGKYKIELQNFGDYLQVSLYDKNLKPVKNKEVLSGVAEFTYGDKSVLKAKLIHEDFDELSAKVPLGDFVKCRIILTLLTETIWADYDNECSLLAQKKN